MWATTTHHQNKSYSKSIRQYDKRRTKAILQSAYLHIKITKYHQEIISHLRGCLGAVSLWYNVKKHAKISCCKVQLAYIYKVTFLIFKVSCH